MSHDISITSLTDAIAAFAPNIAKHAPAGAKALDELNRARRAPARPVRRAAARSRDNPCRRRRSRRDQGHCDAPAALGRSVRMASYQTPAMTA
jgi:hypothetical protein